MEIHPDQDHNVSKQFFFTLGEGKFIPHHIRYYDGHFELKEDKLDSWRIQTAQAIHELVKWAPTYLQDTLFYRPFCEKQGLMVDYIHQSPLGPIRTTNPQIPFSEQTYEELVGNIRWQDFMATYVPSREALIKSVGQVIARIPRRDTRYIDLIDVKLFDQSMEIGGYKIALELIPDLTNDEVKKIFGGHTSLEQIQYKISM